MKKYVLEFLKRGALFGGLGPIIAGFVYMIIGFAGTELKLEGYQIFVAILTSYFLAFVQAGASVFEQIEEFSCFKSLLIHMLVVYFAYLFTYLVNSWIEFRWEVILIFSAIVIVGFLLVWLLTYFLTRRLKNQLNQKL